MRRTSPLAADIASTLAEVGVNVSERRLEGWAQEGLNPAGSAPFAYQLEHYRTLAKVAGPGRGRSADLAARRLAAHGFLCRRLHGALIRGFKVPEVGQPELALDFSTDESTDAAFDRLDEIVDALLGSIGQLPLPIRTVVEKFRQNAERGAPSMGETGESVFRAALVNLLCPLLGGMIYDARPIAAVFGVTPDEVDQGDMDIVNEQLPIRAWEVDDAYRTIPVDQIVVLAQWLRQRAPLAASFLGLDMLTESQLDDFSALVAPYAWHVLGLIYTHLDDAREALLFLELPAGLRFPQPPRRSLSA